MAAFGQSPVSLEIPQHHFGQHRSDPYGARHAFPNYASTAVPTRTHIPSTTASDDSVRLVSQENAPTPPLHLGSNSPGSSISRSPHPEYYVKCASYTPTAQPQQPQQFSPYVNCTSYTTTAQQPSPYLPTPQPSPYLPTQQASPYLPTQQASPYLPTQQASSPQAYYPSSHSSYQPTSAPMLPPAVATLATPSKAYTTTTAQEQPTFGTPPSATAMQNGSSPVAPPRVIANTTRDALDIRLRLRLRDVRKAQPGATDEEFFSACIREVQQLADETANYQASSSKSPIHWPSPPDTPSTDIRAEEIPQVLDLLDSATGYLRSGAFTGYTGPSNKLPIPYATENTSDAAKYLRNISGGSGAKNYGFGGNGGGVAQGGTTSVFHRQISYSEVAQGLSDPHFSPSPPGSS